MTIPTPGVMPNTAALNAAVAQARIELQQISSFASMETSDAELSQLVLGALNAAYSTQFPATQGS
jgi:hypothetical protein